MTEQFLKLEKYYSLKTGNPINSFRLFFVIHASQPNDIHRSKELCKGIAKLFEETSHEIAYYVNNNNNEVYQSFQEHKSFESTVDLWNLNALNTPLSEILGRDIVSTFLQNDQEIEDDFDSMQESDNVKNTLNILFIISPENNSNVEDCARHCNQLKLENVKVVPIGCSESFGRSICSWNSYYTFESIINLRMDIAGLIGNSRILKPECMVSFSTNSLTSIGESACIKFRFKNVSNNKMERVIIDFDANSYFERCVVQLGNISPNEVIEQEQILNVKRGASVKELVNGCIVYFSISTNNSQVPAVCNCTHFYLLAQMFMRDILEFQSRHSVNQQNPKIKLVVNGPVGCGKSNLINSIFQIMSLDRNKSPADAGNSGETTRTKAITDYTIGEYLGNKMRTSILIRDVWGKEMTNDETIPFDVDVLMNILNGYYEDGYNPTLQQFPKTNLIVQQPQNLMDAVILVIKFSLYDKLAMDEVRRYCNLLHEQRREYVLVITFADVICEGNLSSIFSSENTVKNKILDTLTKGKNALDAKKIFFISNLKDWKNNVEENRFSQTIAIFLLLRYILSNYDLQMERVLQFNTFFRQNRFIDRESENIAIMQNGVENREFKLAGSDSILKLNISGMASSDLENELRKEFNICDDNGIILFDEHEEIYFDTDEIRNSLYGIKGRPIVIEKRSIRV